MCHLFSAAFSENVLGVWNERTGHASGCLHVAPELDIWIGVVAHASYNFSLPQKEDQIWDSRQLSTDGRLHDSANIGRRDGDQRRGLSCYLKVGDGGSRGFNQYVGDMGDVCFDLFDRAVVLV